MNIKNDLKILCIAVFFAISKDRNKDFLKIHFIRNHSLLFACVSLNNIIKINQCIF